MSNERPLPLVTPETEPFWTSGADGVLRLPRCRDCGQLLHPSMVVCPDCHGAELEQAEVSGRATVLGYTVNYQAWLPGYAPPYVVAVVAVLEEPSVRLTTNIVACEPDAVHVGMSVRVVFEQHDDVWLSLIHI